MHIKRPNWFDFDVWCPKCNTAIVVDGPDGVSKGTNAEGEIELRLACPKCGNEIVFGRRIGIMIPDEMMLQIKNKV